MMGKPTPPIEVPVGPAKIFQHVALGAGLSAYQARHSHVIDEVEVTVACTGPAASRSGTWIKRSTIDENIFGVCGKYVVAPAVIRVLRVVLIVNRHPEEVATGQDRISGLQIGPCIINNRNYDFGVSARIQDVRSGRGARRVTIDTSLVATVVRCHITGRFPILLVAAKVPIGATLRNRRPSC
jgi:hypothetical protein